MDTNIQEFISGKRIAIAGVSRSGQKFGNIAHKELKARGYEVFLIHPEAREIAGDPCYPRLSDLRGKLDGVLVSLPPGRAGEVLREAAAIGVHNVWLQAGAETKELLALGNDLGLKLVSGKCLLMYAPPVRGFHGLHRFVNRLTGQL